jgi:transposase
LLLRQHAKLREAARTLSEAIRTEGHPVTAASRDVTPRLNVWQRLGVARRAARLSRYDEIVRRRDLGESFKQIGRAMELDQRTVAKFVRAGSFPERAPRTSGLTLLDGHRQYVASRTTEGCVKPVHVWNELRARGFTGSLGTVRSAMARDRAAAAGMAPTTGVPKCHVRPHATPMRGLLAGTADIQPSESTTIINASSRRCCRIEPSIAVGGSLGRHFLGLIHRRDLSGFDRWLDRAHNCVVPELRRFAASLRADLDAVRAAFSSRWSSGQVEGHVNRLKFLKRQMYSRASLDLLRVRVLHPN